MNRLYENWHPVCLECHNNKCHSIKNWVKSKSNPVWDNHNKQEFVDRLILGMKMLQEQ